MSKRAKSITFLIGIIIIIAIVYIWFIKKHDNQIENLKTEEIQCIVLSLSSQYYTITKQEDIRTVISTLQNIKLRRKSMHHKDGYVLGIDISLKNGEEINITTLSEDITINNQNYQPDKDYSQQLKDMFYEISSNYQFGI